MLSIPMYSEVNTNIGQEKNIKIKRKIKNQSMWLEVFIKQNSS